MKKYSKKENDRIKNSISSAKSINSVLSVEEQKRRFEDEWKRPYMNIKPIKRITEKLYYNFIKSLFNFICQLVDADEDYLSVAHPNVDAHIESKWIRLIFFEKKIIINNETLYKKICNFEFYLNGVNDNEMCLFVDDCADDVSDVIFKDIKSFLISLGAYEGDAFLCFKLSDIRFLTQKICMTEYDKFKLSNRFDL